MTVMRVALLFVVAVSVAVLLAFTPALAAAPSAPVLLQLKGQAGDQARYRTELDFGLDLEVNDPSGGVSVTVKPRLMGWLTSAVKTTAVSPSGDLTMSGRVEAFDLKLDLANLHLRAAIDPMVGRPQLVRLPDLPIRAVLSPRGKLMALEGLDKLPIPPLPGPGGQKINLAQMVSKLIGQFSQPVLPEKPVAPGDTWKTSASFDMTEMLKNLGLLAPDAAKQMEKLKVPVTTTYTFTGYETVDGVEAAVIRGEAPWRLELPAGGPEAPMGTLTEVGNTTLTMRLVPSTGKVVMETTDITLEMSVKDQAASPVRTTMTGKVTKKLVK